MTLTATFFTPAYVIQVSDRRMISLPSGQLVDDDANKGVVLQADDGVFAITFAGVGAYAGKRMDLWLAERMAAEGVPELPIARGIEVIVREATQYFSTFRGSVDKRHSFVVAGYGNSVSGATARAWAITNCITRGGELADVANDVFEVLEFKPHGSGGGLLVFGLARAIARADRRRFEAAARKSGDMNHIEAALVDMVRRPARRTKRNAFICSAPPRGFWVAIRRARRSRGWNARTGSHERCRFHRCPPSPLAAAPGLRARGPCSLTHYIIHTRRAVSR